MKVINRSDRAPWLALGAKVFSLVIASAAMAACGNVESSAANSTAVAEARYSYSLSGTPSESANLDVLGSHFRAQLLPTSLFGGIWFRYDTYVLTPKTTGTVTISGKVIDANPDGYKFGYGFPISLSEIAGGADLGARGGNYVKNALNDGEAVTEYALEAGKQYVLVYKTFDKFTPLTYELTLPSDVQVEGKIAAVAVPVPDPAVNEAPITLANPRPKALSHIVEQLDTKLAE